MKRYFFYSMLAFPVIKSLGRTYKTVVVERPIGPEITILGTSLRTSYMQPNLFNAALRFGTTLMMSLKTYCIKLYRRTAGSRRATA